MSHFDGRVEVVSKGPTAIPMSGPFQLMRVESVPFDKRSLREGIWRLTWPSGTMLHGSWSKAMDWLDDRVAKNTIARDAILLAGPFSVPWLLEFYLVAAQCAEENNKEGVFDAYAKSASLLLGQDSEYREALLSPWVEERAQRAAV